MKISTEILIFRFQNIGNFDNIPGTHEIIVSTDNQSITLRHEVYDRALFADGALAAVRFLTGKGPGLYEMRDIIR